MSKCVVLVGGIASGKSTLAKEFEKYGFRRIITYTTRPERNGEIDGVDYHFISNEEFLTKLNSGFFAESSLYTSEFGYFYYGSAKKDYNTSDNTVIVLNPLGVINLTNSAFIVYLDLPEEILLNRAEDRGDSLSQISKRITEDKLYFEEMLKVKNPDLVITFEMPADTIVEYVRNIIKND